MQEVWSKLGVKSTLSTVGSHVCGLACINNVCTYTRGVYPIINITSIPNNTLSPGKGVPNFTGYGPCAKPCAAVIHYCLMLPSAIYPRASEHSSSLFRVHPASLCAICAFVHHLRLCAPSVPLCTICVSVRHLRLCAPSAPLCAICVFVRHLSSISVSLSNIASAAAAHATASAAAARCHCCHHTLPLLPPHATAGFYAICALFCSCRSANHRGHRDGGATATQWPASLLPHDGPHLPASACCCPHRPLEAAEATLKLQRSPPLRHQPPTTFSTLSHLVLALCLTCRPSAQRHQKQQGHAEDHMIKALANETDTALVEKKRPEAQAAEDISPSSTPQAALHCVPIEGEYRFEHRNHSTRTTVCAEGECWIPCLWFGMYKQRVYIYPRSLPKNKYHIYSQQHFISRQGSSKLYIYCIPSAN